MSVIHAPRKPQLDARQASLLVVVFLCLFAFFMRLWYLQVVRSDELSEKANALRTSRVSILAPRGRIVDRNGKLLAGVRQEIVITAKPGEIDLSNPWVLHKLAAMLSTPVEKLIAKVKDASWRPHIPTAIYVGAPIELGTRIAEAGAELPGIGVETQPMRYYPDTKDFAHVLGYVWTPNHRDEDRLAKANIKPAKYIGKDGVERFYEGELMGAPGAEVIELDDKRRPVRVTGRENPVAGNQLTLTIDSDLQKMGNELLAAVRKQHPNSGGAVVAIDPRNGEIICLSSSPTFDTGLFEGGISSEDFRMLQSDPHKPLYNRAINGSYAPGSTFKIVTAIAAMKAGIFDPNRTVYCPGYYQIGNSRPKCLGHHGAVAFSEAMAKSCNTYFMDLGFRVKKKGICDSALTLGLGKRFGIDMPGEGAGTIPTDEWLRRVGNLGPEDRIPWYPGNTVNLGIGQGEISATPLQMAQVAALVANEGVAYKPHLVRGYKSSSANGEFIATEAEESNHLKATPAFWASLKGALHRVITEGTAKNAQIPGIPWAGKTGSSEHRKKGGKTHSWFIGFAPLDNPRIAIAVLVEEAGHGNEYASPIATKIVKRYLLGGDKDANAAANVSNAESENATPAGSPAAR